jgi:hypothetical protein
MAAGAVLVVPALASAAPAVSAVTSPQPGMVHVVGSGLLGSRVLTLTTTSGTLRIYRLDGSRAADNPAGSTVTWSDGSIDVTDDTILAGSRVTAVQTTSDSSNRLVASTWVAPTSLAASPPPVDGQLRLTGHRLSQMPYVHVETAAGNWKSFSNPRAARPSTGVVTWTEDAVLVQSQALAGQQVQDVRLSESASPTSSYIADLPVSVTVAGGVRPSVAFASLPARTSLEPSGTISFTLNGSPTTVTCQLDNSPVSSCADGSFTYSGIADSDHTLNVHVSNAAGSQDASTIWTVSPFKVHTDGLAAELVIDYRSQRLSSSELMGVATLDDGSTVNLPFGSSFYRDTVADTTAVSYPDWSLTKSQTRNMILGAHWISQPTGGEGGNARASVVHPMIAGRTITRMDLYTDASRTHLVSTQQLGAGITVPALPAWFAQSQFAQDSSPDSSYLSSHPVAAATIQFDNIYYTAPVFTDFTEVQTSVISNSGQVVQLVGHLPARGSDTLRIYDVSARSMKLQALGLDMAAGPWRMRGVMPYIDGVQLNTYGYDASGSWSSHRLLPVNDTALGPEISSMHLSGQTVVIDGQRLRWMRSLNLRDQDGWAPTTTFPGGVNFGTHSFNRPVFATDITSDCPTFTDTRLVCNLSYQQYTHYIAGASDLHIGSNSYDMARVPDVIWSAPEVLTPTGGTRITSVSSPAPGTLRVEGYFPAEPPSTSYSSVQDSMSVLTTSSSSLRDTKASTSSYDEADPASPFRQGVITFTGLTSGETANVLRMAVTYQYSATSSSQNTIWLDIPNVLIQ